ncbi:sigma-70 family RNA polymerase sigma factor [Pseudomonas otitidis]|uniref:sigma-70 family RNA polymerase sigma factor n=1 Tax=Metapseudomonas otitidis TaxID=319939 RepID=UPI002E7BAF22|nr:sigma-70 family RNA polymerase sigma factor [Pseudomonas otitidis]MEE1894438.1 sigma-70 family RNA polymerase sigma factor [Pseudomonas otitidis]
MHDIDDDELRELLQRLRRFALWLTREPASADDLVQATVERALGDRQGPRQAESLRAWLFAILYRKFLDGQRRARRYAKVLGFFGLAGADETPSLEAQVEARSTLNAFARLPAEQRALLVLVGVEGLSYKEAAVALELPIGTVMSRLSRARKALRALAEGEIASPSLRILK